MPRYTNPKQIFAQGQRRSSTRAEGQMWKLLQGGRLGVRFRRQVVICGYIADFYCPEKHLVLEVDGPHHDTTRFYDMRRDWIMRQSGYRVIRVPASRALYNNPESLIPYLKARIHNDYSQMLLRLFVSLAILAFCTLLIAGKL